MSVQATTRSSRNRIARSTLIVMGGMLASMAVGFVRQRVIAAEFGTSLELDAYTAANGLPELLFTMLAGGALSFAFIPIYSEYVSSGDRPGGNRLLSQVVNSIFLLAVVASALAALAAPTLVRAPWGLGPHFSPGAQQLTVELMRLLLMSTVLFAISSFATGVLHAHQHFLLPALSPIMYSVGVIFGALALAPGFGIHGLAWGAIAGATLHLGVQIPGLIRYRVSWRPLLGWGDQTLQRVAVLMAPRVVDLMLARASIDWLNSNIGSGLGEGRLSALRFAFQIMNMPWTLVGTAIGIAIFPTLAAMVASDALSAQRRALSGALRAILTLTLPAAVGLLLLGRPVIQLLFEGGEFTRQSTELVYFALRFYVVALVSQSVLEVVVRAFASRKDTLTPLLVSLFTTSINIGLAFWLTRPGGYEHGGLALANGVAVGIESLIGLIILHRRWGMLHVRRVLTDLARTGIACAAMTLVILLTRGLVPQGPLAQLAVSGGLGALAYFAVALALGMREIITLPLAIIRESGGNEAQPKDGLS